MKQPPLPLLMMMMLLTMLSLVKKVMVQWRCSGRVKGSQKQQVQLVLLCRQLWLS